MHDLGAAARRHLGTADDSMYWALCARAVPGRRHDSTVRYAVMIAAALIYDSAVSPCHCYRLRTDLIAWRPPHTHLSAGGLHSTTLGFGRIARTGQLKGYVSLIKSDCGCMAHSFPRRSPEVHCQTLWLVHPCEAKRPLQSLCMAAFSSPWYQTKTDSISRPSAYILAWFLHTCIDISIEYSLTLGFKQLPMQRCSRLPHAHKYTHTYTTTQHSRSRMPPGAHLHLPGQQALNPLKGARSSHELRPARR